jgi:hypothetical protein
MKSLSICIVLTLFSLSASFGYQWNEVMEFVDDCRIMSSDAKSLSVDDTIKEAKAFGYIMGVVASKEYSVWRLANESSKKWSIQPTSSKDLLTKSEKQTYGYIMPDNISARLLAKVIVKYADDNPEKLTKGVISLVEGAFMDAWGEK